MLRLIIIVLLAAAAWKGYGEYQSRRAPDTFSQSVVGSATSAAPVAGQPSSAPTSAYRCDGRTHCSQMTSCAEASYFLKNCPGTKMDGNHDGIPCEKQWCKR